MVHKLLVVDDDKQQLVQCMTYLSKFHEELRLFTAPNGKIACVIAKHELPDVIVMDWTMPEMTGHEALVRLKENPSTAHIPVIMATALTTPEDVQLAFESGAFDYLKKPYHNLELLMRVRKALAITNRIAQLERQVKG